MLRVQVSDGSATSFEPLLCCICPSMKCTFDDVGNGFGAEEAGRKLTARLKRMAPPWAIARKSRGLHTGWETARGTVQKAAQCRSLAKRQHSRDFWRHHG